MIKNTTGQPPYIISARGVQRKADGYWSFTIYTNTGIVIHDPTWWFPTEKEAEAAAHRFREAFDVELKNENMKSESLPLDLHVLN